MSSFFWKIFELFWPLPTLFHAVFTPHRFAFNFSEETWKRSSSGERCNLKDIESGWARPVIQKIYRPLLHLYRRPWALVLTGRLHPPVQETTPACRNSYRERKPKIAFRRAGTALAVEECVNARYTLSAINLSCFGGFCSPADDPPKPWRRWVWFLGTTGLPVGLHIFNIFTSALKYSIIFFLWSSLVGTLLEVLFW